MLPLRFLITFAVCILWVSALQAQSILFVGNSFTFSGTNYNSANITDANGTGQGGIPGIFKKMATEGGYNPSVTIEAEATRTLEWHYTNKQAIIGQSWDIIVLQEYSSRPLISPSGEVDGTNVPAFRQAISNISTLARNSNPNVQIYLYETWARPDLVISGLFDSLEEMQTELRTAYSQAATDFNLAGWVPVGDTFLKAVSDGYTDDPSTAPTEGEIPLWDTDNRHQSRYGSYLAASVFYNKLLGGDSRTLPTGAGSAVAGLGLNQTYAELLQDVAYNATPIPEPPSVLLAAGIIGLVFTFRTARAGHLRS